MMQIHKSLGQPIASPSESRVKSNDTTGYRLSEKELDNLSGRETKEKAEKEASSDMPDHIAKMIEQLKKIKEQIELQKQQLLKLKALDNQQDEAVKAQVKAQANLVTSIQTQMVSLVQTISDAMKEAGVTDPGTLISAMV
ncbi:hypothetical protein [Pseudoalteromonas prydzensis]|uniref:hypothetical protein n=1 Tax=Pseudoalteromonas prydzensis TaxID=182141 RepID=UPI0024BCEAE7|nr:hypothetical protein [Pseudoalteromonas prydzensis]